jgi:hypothetical protein
MTDKLFHKYQSYFPGDKGEQRKGIIITARCRKDAQLIADGMYGEESTVEYIKEVKK